MKTCQWLYDSVLQDRIILYFETDSEKNMIQLCYDDSISILSPPYNPPSPFSLSLLFRGGGVSRGGRGDLEKVAANDGEGMTG